MNFSLISFFLPSTQIEVETVDRTGTFIGTLWESRSNVAVTLLEAGLAKLQTSFGTDRIAEVHLLMQAEQAAKRQKLKARASYVILISHVFVLYYLLTSALIQIWENYVEGEEVVSSGAADRRQKEELKVM